MARVSDAEVERQRNALLQMITAFPTGVGRETLAREYEARFGVPIQWRTLLRRLRDLTEAGRIYTASQGRSRVYISAWAPAGVPAASQEPEDEEYVPLSAAGAEVRDLMRRPISQREPVGYRLEF